jgi:hypothetical protein
MKSLADFLCGVGKSSAMKLLANHPVGWAVGFDVQIRQ